MKQETIEEFIESQPYYGTCTYEYKEGIKEGAKWQQETYNQFTLAIDDLKSSREGYLKAKLEYELKQQNRSYSEEEVKEIILERDRINHSYKYGYIRELTSIKEWFEQFKKK